MILYKFVLYQSMPLINLSAAYRVLQHFQAEIAAGHNHHHFFSREPFLYFTGGYQRDRARRFGHVVRTEEREADSFENFLFGQKHNIGDAVFEYHIGQLENTAGSQAVGHGVGVIKNNNVPFLP